MRSFPWVMIPMCQSDLLQPVASIVCFKYKISSLKIYFSTVLIPKFYLLHLSTMNFTLLFCVHHKIHMNTHNFVPFSDTLLDGKGNAFSLSTPGGGPSQVPSLFPDSGPQPESFPGGSLASGSMSLLGGTPVSRPISFQGYPRTGVTPLPPIRTRVPPTTKIVYPAPPRQVMLLIPLVRFTA